MKKANVRELVDYNKASWLRANLQDVDFSGATMLRQFILDQNFIHEFKSQGASAKLLYWFWWITSDCGRSIARWLVWIAVAWGAFGFAYSRLPVDFGDYPTALSPYYFSFVTLTTLGYGDAVPASVGAQVAAMVEVAIGYVLLGGLISIFSNKLARRA